MAGGKNSAHKILLRERRAVVLDLRKRGESYRSIADRIRIDPRFNQPNYSEKTARDDCSNVLQQLAENTRSDAVELRTLELERLNLAISSLARQVESGSLEAIDRWLKVIGMRCKILGLNLDTDALNKAFAAFTSYGYEIRDRKGGGYELIDEQAAPSASEIEQI